MRLDYSIIAQPFSLNQYTVLVSMLDSIIIRLFHYTGHDGVEDAIPKLQQLSLKEQLRMQSWSWIN